ncbi:hypothetical protein ACQPZP_30640 [Spirillospora sp. CA-142024]|uniref:hypothetical protein n=1 Tax=Spirillospora sp. CA-142024 TaxID=3240036 RepID=UPI003D8E300B
MAQESEGTDWRDAVPTVVNALGDQFVAGAMFPAEEYTPEEIAAFKAVGVKRPDENDQRDQGAGESH